MSKTIDSSAVLVELSSSVWTGRKLDRNVSREVDATKNTKTRTASVYKDLMPEVSSLDAIEKFVGHTRQYHYRMTLPWSDSGPRLLPSTLMFEYMGYMRDRKNEFQAVVDTFLAEYDTQIGAMAFKTGAMFSRADYPTRDSVAGRFRLDYVLSPVPTSGDFRLDVGREAQEALRRKYEKAVEARVRSATDSLYADLHDTLLHTVERLGETDGKPHVFRDSLVENLQDMVVRLKKLNVFNDSKLVEFQGELASVAQGLTPQDLRKNEAVRSEVRSRMSDILNKMNGG